MPRLAERGMSNSVQVVVLLPLTFGIFLTLLQWSFNAWAEATALAGAQEAAAASSVVGGTVRDGESSGADVTGNGSLTDVVVTVERGARETVATVEGRPMVVLWPSSIRKSVTVPTERLSSP